MLSKKELVSTLIKSLKIDDNIFNYETINDEIEFVPNESYIDFYKQVMKEESFGNGIKAILKVADKFKKQKEDLLLAGTREQAKEIYNKFYSECNSMLDYTLNNRDKISSDRDFFINMPYKELKRKDGTNIYTKIDLYVLNALGGGNWLIDIRFTQNVGLIIDKIEKIIKDGKITKYMKLEQISDNRKITKLLEPKRI